MVWAPREQPLPQPGLTREGKGSAHEPQASPQQRQGRALLTSMAAFLPFVPP